jgi:hypothetical protein
MNRRHPLLVAIVSSGIAGCATLFGQADGFREKLSAGCATVADCEQLVSLARARHKRCAPNEIGKLRCEDTSRDLDTADGLLTAAKDAIEAQGRELRARLELERAASARSEDAQRREEGEKRREARLAELAATSEAESREGKCNPKRAADLQARLYDLRRLRNPFNELQELHLEEHKIQPIAADGLTLHYEPVLSGTIHVFALGYASPTKLKVTNAAGDEARLASTFRGMWPDTPNDEFTASFHEQLRAKEVAFDASRMIEVNSNETLAIQVHGTGCVLVAIYREL